MIVIFDGRRSENKNRPKFSWRKMVPKLLKKLNGYE